MRTLVAGVLLLVGALLVPVSTATWWARHDVLPADGYAETVAPLATDPAITGTVEDRLTTTTMTALTDRLGLAPVAGSVARPLVRQGVALAVADPGFADAWQQANRELHRQAIGVLSDRSTARPASTLSLDLAPLSVLLKRRLSSAGVPFADQLPSTTAAVPVVGTAGLVRARTAYRVLDDYGPALPVVTILLLLAGLVVARRRGTALALTGLVALLGLGATWVAVLAGRTGYLDRVPSGLSRPAASAVFDAVTSGLRTDLVVVGVVVALALVAGVVAVVVARRDGRDG